jgi:CheY-like chemotaxis protein
VLPEDKEYFLSHGANAVLPKPVDIKALLECISAQRALGLGVV